MFWEGISPGVNRFLFVFFVLPWVCLRFPMSLHYLSLVIDLLTFEQYNFSLVRRGSCFFQKISVESLI